MNDAPPPNWKPSPELLAAFADGELDARDDAAELRARLEAWLANNPQAQIELAANRRLKALFDRTTPSPPPAESWRELMNRIERMPMAPPARRSPTATWFVGAAAAAACVLWAILLAGSFWSSPPAAPEVFAIAADDEVEIVHIEGNALESLVVGLLPLRGVLELADPGEVVITSVTPASRDNMIPVVYVEGSSRRPMIWAPLENEGE